MQEPQGNSILSFRAKSRNLSLVKCFRLIAFLTLANAATSAVHATPDSKIALVNGTLINPGAAKITPNALVLIEGDHVSAVGDQVTAISTKGAQIIDCKNKSSRSIRPSRPGKWWASSPQKIPIT